MSSILEKLKNNSTIKESSVLSESKFFTEKDMIQTDIPMLNVALSGKLTGGFVPGLTMFAAPSKHFKTTFSLIMASSYLKKYKDAVLMFIDSEFGTPITYFNSFGIDLERVLHVPVTDVEQLKHELTAQLQQIEKGDKIIIVIDSIGNLASKKEVDDAADGKSVADMSRAKQIKSLFRIVTPHLTLKDIPMIVVNHTYKTMELYAKDVVGGGTGSYYSSDNIFIVGRQQEKDGTELLGYNFIINVEKSRYVKEKSKIPICVTFDGGINRYSGLVDIALETGWLAKPKQGWYSLSNPNTGEIEDQLYRLKDIADSSQFWEPLLKNEEFQTTISNKFSLYSEKNDAVDNE